ncbi:MAG: hypothetical protein RIE24_23145 [Silicimonas sp.]
MPRPPILAMLALSGAAAVLGLALGLRPELSETQVIEAGAAIYAEETGGSRSECIGVPASGEGWIAVRCGDAGDIRTYVFDRSGALIGPRREPTT